MVGGPHTTAARATSTVLNTCVSLLSIVELAKSQSSCSEGIITLPVSTTAKDWNLATRSTTACTGSGEFEVNWSGNVLLSQIITVQNRTVLTVRGVGAEAAVIDEGDAHARRGVAHWRQRCRKRRGRTFSIFFS
ncbi:unnamed protein product [Ectocarpus sp. CCAP 1310/34]|nr:unnamed protein product [Ectocarpus sp. CCAP 1310/34]